MDAGSIREKANKWLGRGVALDEARKKEQFKIHFLLGEPRQEETKKALENAIHLLNKIPGPKEIVRESELEQFAEHVAEEIGAHHPAAEMVLRDKRRDRESKPSQ